MKAIRLKKMLALTLAVMLMILTFSMPVYAAAADNEISLNISTKASADLETREVEIGETITVSVDLTNFVEILAFTIHVDYETNGQGLFEPVFGTFQGGFGSSYALTNNVSSSSSAPTGRITVNTSNAGNEENYPHLENGSLFSFKLKALENAANIGEMYTIKLTVQAMQQMQSDMPVNILSSVTKVVETIPIKIVETRKDPLNPTVTATDAVYTGVAYDYETLVSATAQGYSTGDFDYTFKTAEDELLDGPPTAVGSYEVIATLKDEHPHAASGSDTFEITLPKIKMTVTPAAPKINTPLEVAFELETTEGVVGSITWELVTDLESEEVYTFADAALNFDSSTGKITGTPKIQDDYTFSVIATFDFDNDGTIIEDAQSFRVNERFTVTSTGGVYYPGGIYIPSTITPTTNTGSTIAEDAFNGGLTVSGGVTFTQKQLQDAYKLGYLTITGRTSKAADGTSRPVVFTLAVSAITRAANATKNLSTPFEFRFDTSAGAFYLPSNIISLIPKYKSIVSGKGEIFIKVTITEKKSTRNGELTPVVDFKLHLVDAKGAVIGDEIKLFTGAITRTLPLKKDVTKPAYYGTQNRADSTKDWNNSFLPTVTDGNKFKISSKTNSEYVVTEFKSKFTDVEAGKWFETAVITAASKGLVNGMTATTFEPESTLTRAQFVAMIERVLQLPVPEEGTREYSDLASAAWAKESIQKARSAGIIALLTTGTNEFKPDQPITREEMAYVIAKAADYAKLTAEKGTIDLSKTFSDVAEISANYANYIEATVSMKLLEGNADGTFNPKGELTRAQGATALIRLCLALGYID